jgi:hypothetical protein
MSLNGDKIEYNQNNDTYIIQVNDDSVKVRNPANNHYDDVYSSYYKFVKPVLPPHRAGYAHILPNSKTDKNCNDITFGHSAHAVYGPYDSNLQILPEGTTAVSIPTDCYSKNWNKPKKQSKYDEIVIKGYDSSTHEYICSVEGSEDDKKIPITGIRLKCGAKECADEWPFINIEKTPYVKDKLGFLEGRTFKTNDDAATTEELPSSVQVEGIDGEEGPPPPNYEESKDHESLGGSRKRKSKKQRKSKRKSNRRRKSRKRRL